MYFNALFGIEFSRALSLLENAALNYGYSLILSALNREIAAAGYLTQLGTYNLGCDLMEPLRLLINNAVVDMLPQSFEKEEKHALVRLLHVDVRLTASDMFSFTRCVCTA